MTNKVWVFVGKTEDCEQHILAFDHKPSKKELKAAFEELHDGLYVYSDLFEESLHELVPRPKPALKKSTDGPY